MLRYEVGKKVLPDMWINFGDRNSENSLANLIQRFFKLKIHSNWNSHLVVVYPCSEIPRFKIYPRPLDS